MKQFLSILIFLLLTTIVGGCFIGAGTHGSIETFYFKNSNAEIVSIVDDFLIKNPEYRYKVDESSGWVYIKIPPGNDKFGFRIGGKSEINLIAAGKENEPTRWNSKLGTSEKQKFIENFKENFIDKLKKTSPTKVKLLKEPFILSSNLNPDTTLWPHYVIKHDTLISYPLPIEIDSTNIDYFEDIVLSFAKSTNQNLKAQQYHNIYRINKEYSGYIDDSIYITTYYRVIGEKINYNTIFSQTDWAEYVSEKNIENREYDILKIRDERIDKGYSETDVYSENYEELWMLNNQHLEIKNGK